MKKIIIALIILAIIVFGIISIKKNNRQLTQAQESVVENVVNQVNSEQGVSQNTPPESTNTATTQTSSEKVFTLTQVATHNTEADCYSAINGKVYDLTAWINKHPGGDRAILSICGKDGSAAFDGEHGGESRPEKILLGFEVGTLTQ